MKDTKPDVPGPDSLTERLNLWKNRSTFDSYTDRAVRGAQVTDGQARSIRAFLAGERTAFPQPGDVAAVPCPHCDGPMYVVSIVHDEVAIQCPTCQGKKK